MLGFVPHPNLRAFVIVGDFFMRFDIAPRDHAQVIVIAGVWVVGMINILEVTADLEPLGFAKPDYVGAIPLA